MTKADIAVLPFIRQLAIADREWLESLPFKHVHTWFSGFMTSDLHDKVMAKSGA